MIYLDNAATTKIDTNVVDVFEKFEQKYYHHPDNNKEIKKVSAQLDEKIIDILKLKNRKIIKTCSGSSANYNVIVGFAKRFESKKHFITTMYEHTSVMRAFEQVRKLGHEVTYLKEVNDCFEIKENTVMVSIIGVNNEVGFSNDINAIAKYVKSVNEKICFHCDIVQHFVKYKFFDDKNIDIYTLSPHKFYGPKNIGLIFKAKDVDFELFEEGTSALSFYAMSVKAIHEHVENFEKNTKNINLISKHLKSELALLDYIEFNDENDGSIINFNVDVNLMSESMITYFKENGIIISAKSACSTKSKVRSVSLMALEISKSKIDKSLRVSIGKYNKIEEVDCFVSVLKKMIGEFK